VSTYDRKTSTTRRQFLETATGAVAGASLVGIAPAAADVQSTSRASSRVLGANDRIRLGFIGCGMQFQDLLRRGFLPRRERQGDIEFVEVCDVWQPRVDNAKAKTGAERGGREYQVLLARPDIDGVVIVVPDHLHYPMARAALLAGKDVYLEKPMTHTIDEAARLHDLVQQTGRMLQVGGSGLNSPLHQQLHAYVASGKMGQVVWGSISYNRNTTEGMWDYPIPGIGSTPWPDAPVTAENLDWKAWLGDAPKRPFSKERYFRWRKFWDYSGGNATDLLFHRLGALSAIVGFDFPSRVVGAGGIYVQKNRQVPDTYMTTVEYPKAYCFNMVSCMANADSAPIAVHGNWGTLQVLPNVRQPGQSAGTPPTARAVVRAEREFLARFKDANDGRDEVEIATTAPIEDLADNWLNSMRSRQTPIYDVLKGYQVTVAIQLGVQSYREGRALGYDPTARRILTRLPDRREYPPQGS
jgi:predicted dehydrogenase